MSRGLIAIRLAGIRLHRADQSSEILNLFPVGEFNDRPGISGAFCHPHDKPYYLPVAEAIPGIIKFTCKNGQFLRLPGNLLQELL